MEDAKIAFTIEEFCHTAGLGKTSIYADIKAGKLSVRKRGRRTIILRADADAYLRALPVHDPKSAVA